MRLFLYFFNLHFLYLFAYEINSKDHAIVTLVTGERSGYSAGAIALGQSLIDIGSKLQRIVLVTPEVESFNRELLSKIWTVIDIDPIPCNHKLDPSITPDQFDLQGENYLAGIQRWQATCTKFAVWKLTQFKRVVFMDSDTIVLQPIDDILYEFSNASFVAAPETFPPDTFNSGVMVLNPSRKTFQYLLKLNKEIGSAEGGDQGVFNNGLCPQWFTASSDDPDCGRLPWLFNVEAANFIQYQTLRKMSNLRLPAVVHFVSDGKPWKIIAMEYLNLSIPSTTLIELKKQEYVHLFWRIKYFKATGDQPPQKSLFGEEADQLFQSLLHHVHNKRQNTNYLEKLDILYDRNKKYQEEEEELKRNEIKKLLKNQNKKNFQSRKEEVSSQSSDKKRKKRQNDRKTSRKHRNQRPRQSRNEL